MPNTGTKIFTDTLKYFPATFKFTAKTTEVYLKQAVSDTLYIIQYSSNTLSFLSYGDVTKNSVEQIAHLLNLSLKQPRLPIIPLPQFLPPTMYITPAEQPTPPPRVQPVAPPRVHKQKKLSPPLINTQHKSPVLPQLVHNCLIRTPCNSGTIFYLECTTNCFPAQVYCSMCFPKLQQAQTEGNIVYLTSRG